MSRRNPGSYTGLSIIPLTAGMFTLKRYGILKETPIIRIPTFFTVRESL